ncbi:hypothetical protein RJP21_28445 [Paenibacillus sp. VCA1]|uniref:Uncharacterized protein n=2 Tax=Paenibacillus TaxID=44249 RepID=A0A919XQ78_9BACL|nr:MULTISPECIES: hypothetical protein [Paenibacillus]MDR9857529.1 hypothetical protein [Paenibacillus sp. VCA1]GIO34920.1 hypothetical protein J2TS6_60610 [Paenibacillus albilobatus]
MIVSSNQLGQSLYCSQCGKESEQINVWWKDGRNDDGLGYSEVFAECPGCHAQLMKKNAYGAIDSVEDALHILQNE